MDQADQIESQRITKIPQQLLSVAVPVMPQGTFSNDKPKAERLLRDCSIGIVFLGVGFWVVVDPLKVAWPAYLIFLGIFGLVFVIGRSYAKHLARLDDLEKKVREQTMELQLKNMSLQDQAKTDALTGLLNRRALEKALHVEMSRVKRKGNRVFAALMDCDDFKGVNEKYGHAVGDAVLKNVAHHIEQTIRPTDYGCRIGGDEFIVLLVDLETEEAASVCDRLRLNIKNSPVVEGRVTVPCTCSIGVAELPAETYSIEEVLTLTRQSLKSSKGGGKNQISMSNLPIYKKGH
jgi:diguanylate cyclase (GGDEF)-like protein